MYQALQVLNSGGLLWFVSIEILLVSQSFTQRRKAAKNARLYSSRPFTILLMPSFMRIELKLINKPNL